MSDAAEERKPPSLSRPEDLVDRTIGEFRLLRRLGAGGMAEVYLAEQPSLGRVVAVKVLRPDRVTGMDGSLVERFEREARAAGGLNHANIVQVYQTGEEDGIHYIVQEYVPGSNLAQQIKRGGPPELTQGLQWMIQVAEALHAAAEAGIVHRDIKPENIMLTRGSVAKVADFGLAQLSQQNDQTNLTQTGTTMGTPLYMSPEQIRGSKVDHRSDQYSFGVTCYHMFAGQPPFSSANSVTVAVQHLQDAPPPLAGHRADLPGPLCDAVHRMLAKNPDDRFSSTEELLQTISSLQNLSVNRSLRLAPGLGHRLSGMFPAWPAVLAAILVTVVIGWMIGSRWGRGVRLPDVSGNQFEKQDSAAEQYAAALLQPDNPAAWEAVNDYYPGTDAAWYATLHLSLWYLDQIPPDPQHADELLNSILEETGATPNQKKSLRALAVAGRAVAALEADDASAAARYRSELTEQSGLSAGELDDLLQTGPRRLRQYWNQTRPAGEDFPFFGPPDQELRR